VKELVINSAPSLTHFVPPKDVETIKLIDLPLTSLDLSQADVRDLEIIECMSLTHFVPPKDVKKMTLAGVDLESLDLNGKDMEKLCVKSKSMTHFIPPKRAEKMILGNLGLTSLDLSNINVKDLHVTELYELRHFIPPSSLDTLTLDYMQAIHFIPPPFLDTLMLCYVQAIPFDLSQVNVNNFMITYFTELTHFSPLKHVNHFSLTHGEAQSLDLSGLSVSDTFRIAYCNNLTTLSLKNATLNNLELSYMPKLESVDLAGATIQGELKVARCPKLVLPEGIHAAVS